MFNHWAKSNLIAPLTIVVLILLANALYITGYSNPNPVNTRSGLSSALTNNVLSGQDNIDPNDGFLTQSLGKLSANDILHGKLPFWDYNQQVGAPLAGGMQAASFFPPVLILYLANGSTYFHLVLEIIAGLSMYYLLLRLGFRKLTSTAAGTVFALSSVFVWFWSPNTNPIAFLPLLILGVEIAYAQARTNKKRGWLTIAIALALSIYAGFPEVTGLDGLLALCWFLVRLGQSEKSFRLTFLKKTVTGGIAGLLLASPVIVAFLDYLPYANIGSHAGAITASVNSIGLPALFMPYIYGAIFSLSSHDATGALNFFWSNVGGYITALIFLLALLGFVGIRKPSKHRGIKILLGAWALIMVLRIYGLLWTNTIMSHIPGLSRTAIYRYVQPSVIFALVVLMAFGFEYVLISAGSFKKVKKVLMAAGFAALVLVVLLPIAIHEHDHLLGASHQRLWLVASFVWSLATIAALVLITFLNHKKKLTKTFFGYSLAVLVVIDTLVLFVIPQFSAPRSAAINTQPVTYLQQHLGEYRFYSMGPIMPNYGSYFGIAAINTNNVPVSKAWTSYAETKLNPDQNPLVFTGIAGNDLSPTGETPAQAFMSNIKNYEYIGVKYVAINGGSLTPAQAQQVGLKNVFSDSTATIYELPNPNPYFQIVDGQCSISSSNKTSLTADCQKPSTLLRRELYMPGWKATVGGSKQAVKASGPLFQSINLPKGKSQVTFNFTPKHIEAAFLLFCLTVLGILVYYVPFINKPLVRLTEDLTKK